MNEVLKKDLFALGSESAVLMVSLLKASLGPWFHRTEASSRLRVRWLPLRTD